MSDSYPHVYLSPHYDDAVLSCGGMIHQYTQAGKAVLVVTIFAAPPPSNEPFSAFAQELHATWGNSADIIAVRQAEDQAALTLLGADYLRLNLTDCIYRGRPEHGEWYYTDNDSLFGPVHLHDRSLADQIVAAVTELVPPGRQTILYAPLAIGHHVDHQITRAAAWQLWQQGWTVAFYEDYPYADPSSRFTYRLFNALADMSMANLQPHLRNLAEENLHQKIAGARAYTSQLPTLFDSEAEMEDRLRHYALHVGAGQLCERVWIPG